MRKKTKLPKWEVEMRETLQAVIDEATKNTINAFNEGYMMGAHHAEQIFKGEDKDE